MFVPADLPFGNNKYRLQPHTRSFAYLVDVEKAGCSSTYIERFDLVRIPALSVVKTVFIVFVVVLVFGTHGGGVILGGVGAVVSVRGMIGQTGTLKRNMENIVREVW